MSSAQGLTLGVIVCCRDEARVIERRLVKLGLSAWPAAERRHAVVVVDDGSQDDTARRAAEVGAHAFGEDVAFEVLANRSRPGKAGALATAVAHLAGRVDVLVLTDADVLNASDALVALTDRFATRPDVGMVTGAQRFVGGEYKLGGADPATSLRDAGTFYDRCTSWVRAAESWSGQVFSVHGQLLAWRADLGLVPSLELAADDLDLMRQVRQRGLRVERAGPAQFSEVKLQGEARRAQAIRRVRAYLQFAETLDPARAPDAVTRWQWRFYKHFPPAFPALAAVLVSVFAVLASLALRWGTAPLVPMSIAWMFAVVVLASRLWGPASLVLEAKKLEQVASVEPRWSTPR